MSDFKDLNFLSLTVMVLMFQLFTIRPYQAQAPQGIPYQAIARNASGAAIANTAVKVRFSIRDSIATGPVRYQETHSPTTSALGLFSVNVGMGTVVSGSFAGINWGKNAKFLQVELDPAGGSSYTDLGTTQMMSVPYALQANSIKMRTSATGDTLYTGGGNYVIIPGISAANPRSNPIGSTITDIDGNVYNTVTIGNQIWMKENLKVSRYRNGANIPTNLTNSQWSSTTSGAYAIYNNDLTNNTTYGKLYNAYAVVDPRRLCPDGWHIPTDHDLNLLTINLDPLADTACFGCANNIAGGKMKSIGTIESGTGLYFSPNTEATNSSGFSLLPAGYRFPDGSYGYINMFGYCWSATEDVSSRVWNRGTSYNKNDSNRTHCFKTYGMPVRCLKD